MAPSIRYLTGSTGPHLEDGTALRMGIGLLIQPRSAYHTRLHHYPAWAADNGAFNKKHGFRPALFRKLLAQPELQRHHATCLFVAAPDCLVVHEDGSVVGDARGTLAQFLPWAAEIGAVGLPVALVAQDGLELLLGSVPWHALDVLFIGGSTEWKLGPGARASATEALARGKRVHMGRVNSLKRLRAAQSMGATSADGTFLAFAPAKNLPRLAVWLKGVAA